MTTLDAAVIAQLDDILVRIRQLNDQVITLKRKVQGENPVRDVLALYDELWRSLYGSKDHYQFNRRSDPAHVKRFLKTMDALAVKARVTNYFLDRDQFLVCNKHPFSLFVTRVNKYGAASTPKLPALRPAHCRHEPACSSDTQHTQREMRELTVDGAR